MKATLLSYVLRSKKRRDILSCIAKDKQTASQLKKKTGMYESHVSRALKELSAKNLIKCENPKERRFKFYKITKTGKKTIGETEKILAELGKN